MLLATAAGATLFRIESVDAADYYNWGATRIAGPASPYSGDAVIYPILVPRLNENFTPCNFAGVMIGDGTSVQKLAPPVDDDTWYRLRAKTTSGVTTYEWVAE